MTKSESFKFTSKLTNNANKADIADIEIGVPLKYLSNFWKTIGQWIVYEIDRTKTFSIIDTKRYASVVTGNENQGQKKNHLEKRSTNIITAGEKSVF